MAIVSYWPEMGETKPEGTDGNLSYGGNSAFIQTPLALKGRGITHVSTFRPQDLTERGQYKAGWHCYKVTNAALAKLLSQYTFAREALLD